MTCAAEREHKQSPPTDQPNKPYFSLSSPPTMEKAENGTTTTTTTTTTISACPAPLAPAKKQGGGMSFLRTMMLAFRTSSSSSKKAGAGAGAMVDAATADMVIKTIVAGVRPLHHQLDYKRPLPPPPPPAMALESYYDVHMPPPSPSRSDTSSRYASTEDLQALDMSGEIEEEEYSGNGEPHAIDMKAEEFIAMFYKQMRLERPDTLKMIEEEEQPTVEEEATAEESACMLAIN